MSPGTAELPACGSLNEVVDGNPSVTPFVGLRWMSADLSDDYYGADSPIVEDDTSAMLLITLTRSL